ncbi:MAG: CheR family methyltransferase [Longimicrobiales bacterium]|nr:CheR family methyltransferase [Longimicrobiales bacterium]
MRDSPCVAFLQWALPRLRMRWPGFRKVRRQVCKRLARRLQALGLSDLDAYRSFLGRNPEEWAVLDGMCRVTISRFYRDRAVFDLLRARILPTLGRIVRDAGDPRMLRVWSAGCASGEEPYSVSLCWALDAADRARGVRLDIVGTETDAHLLDRAREACYPAGTLKDLPAAWRRVAFSEEDGAFCLRPGHRAPVRFLRQDIREEAPPGAFELILCRNLVFTYFEAELQRAMLRRLLGHLVVGGFLLVGGHEAPPDHEALIQPFGARPVYRKIIPP